MNKTAVIFGGAGYIGINLIKCLLNDLIFHKIYVCDIKKLEGFDDYIKEGRIIFRKVDVRNLIDLGLNNIDIKNSWIFNFAAVHREPGHNYKEYFDTNIPGSENINAFARETGINNIFFTSSIAPYGKSLEQRSESSNLYPETACGISKALAEKNHQNWLFENDERRLVIVRPSVIFGPKDPGNVYRMIKALKKGTFVLPDGGDVIKGYGYVFGLVESILFVMSKEEKLIIYNYAENPIVSLKGMVSIVKDELGYKRPTVRMSVKWLSLIAAILQVLFRMVGKKSDIHPVRVRKAGFPTNIRPDYLIENGFKFKYDFRNALKHWKQYSPEDFK